MQTCVSANSCIVIGNISPENHKPGDMLGRLTHAEIPSPALPAYLRLTGKIVDHKNLFFFSQLFSAPEAAPARGWGWGDRADALAVGGLLGVTPGWPSPVPSPEDTCV